MNEDLELVFFQNIFDVTFGSVFFKTNLSCIFEIKIFEERKFSWNLIITCTLT